MANNIESKKDKKLAKKAFAPSKVIIVATCAQSAHNLYTPQF